MSADWDQADAICEAYPDGTHLHRRLAIASDGWRVAACLPGSSAGSATIAAALVNGELNGRWRRGTTKRLLGLS